MSPIIRQSTRDDREELVSLLRCLHPDDEPFPTGDEGDRVWDGIIGSEYCHPVVAAIDGKLVSTCYLAISPNLTRGGRPFAQIQNVVTHPDFRRRGYATAVLKRAIDIAWENKCYKIFLLPCREGYDSLYVKLGFETTRTGFAIRMA